MHPHLHFTFYHGKRLHLGVTGSIAAYKSLSLLRHFLETGMSVHVTLTQAATRFVTPLSFRSLGADPVHETFFADAASDFDHLEPARVCQCQLIAPATANFLSKMTHGAADDLLSCQALAFPHHTIVAPAMNPLMWQAPATQANVAALAGRGVEIVPPGTGVLACGDVGQGRLAEEEAIYLAVLRAMSPKDLAGRSVLVSLGPTHEYFDVARYWSNPSSGLMGATLAVAAWLRGARVHVVHGPVSFWLPCGVSTTPVVSAGQMHEAMTDLFPAHDMTFMVAAVSDFSPVPAHNPGEKFKRDVTGRTAPEIRFTQNPDILAALGAQKAAHQILVGFCAETGDLRRRAEEKLVRKNCDIMVANPIGRSDSGFAAATNQVAVLDAHGRFESWPVLPKTEVAWRILDWANRA